MRKLTESNKLLKRARDVLSHQTGTFSRAAEHFVEGVFPVYVKNASGAYFIDVDNNAYLDYLLGLGPITLGYNYPRMINDMIEQLKEGILFSLPHRKEVECAELICQTIPHTDLVKFEKSGSNAVTGAVRAARAITKRDKIAYCGSGGVWHDWQATIVSRNSGVPEFNKNLIEIFDYNDNQGLEQIFEDNKDEIATIVLELTQYEKPNMNFLKKVRKIADTNNAVLILDEIVTGFRFDLEGGQKYFDIKGDLVCFGKGMGNGVPISAITGPSEFMRIFDKLWVSSTNNAEVLSLAATISVINEMRDKNTISHCWKVGLKLFDSWNSIVEKNNLNAKMIGYHVRMMMNCFDSKGNESLELKALILQELIKRGIFMSPSVTFLSFSHSEEDIDKTLTILEKICEKISNTVSSDNFGDFIEGKLPQTVWTIARPPTKKR